MVPNGMRGVVSSHQTAKDVAACRSLVERLGASKYLNKSARLRDLLLYLSARVLDEDATEIHEQEVGHKVFGRAADYDTASDNIVRVHASMLRKRLEQYFASEGAPEPLILEIRKGNYAPVFRERDTVEEAVEEAPAIKQRMDRRLIVAAGLAGVFAITTGVLVWREFRPADSPSPVKTRPAVMLLWSQVFQKDRPTDIVIDDAAVGLYQELTGRDLQLSSYFDRDYLRSLPSSAAAAGVDERVASSIVLRRQTSVSSTMFLWKLLQIPGAERWRSALHFARDYSFRELRADNLLLLGNTRTNPWIEPFQPRLGLRWMYDSAAGVYYPVDTWANGKKYQGAGTGDAHESYCAISLLPNLGGTGSVLIVSGTGGSAINSGVDFLADEKSVSDLLRRLGGSRNGTFPHFETLIKVSGRSGTPRDATVLLCRAPR